MRPPHSHPLNYRQLRDCIAQVFRKGGGTRPDVLHVVVDNKNFVIKDYNATSGWFGLLAGPLLVKREVKALKRLQGINGIPRLFSCTNNRVLVTSYCHARVAAKLTHPINWLQFEQKLNRLIGQIHEKGVAHCDLRGPGNILVNENNQPYLVDYVGCIMRAKSWNKPWNYLFAQGCKADYSAVLKLKQRLAPQQLTVEETHRVSKDSSRGWLFRKTSRGLRRFARWIFAAGKN